MDKQAQREDQFRAMEAILQHAPGGIFSYSADDDRFAFISDNMLQFLGYTREAFARKFDNRFSRMIYAGDRESVLSTIDDQIRGNAFDDCEYRIERGDGTLVWVHDQGHLVTDDEGRRWFYVIILDITETINAKEALAQRNSQLTVENASLQTIADSIPGGIRVFQKTDRGIICVSANQYYADMMGVDKEALIGESFGENETRIHPADLARHRRDTIATLESNHRTEGAYRFFNSRTGTYRWYHIEANLETRPGFAELAYFHYTDINDEREAQMRLQENEAMLREAINSSDIQYYTYYPESHYLDIPILNSHYIALPTHWADYPESFIRFMGMSPSDSRVFRAMIQKIDDGADEASCVTFMHLGDLHLWIKANFTAIKDESGRTIKAQGYANDVTSQKLAEERFQQERIRLKSMDGDIVEAFSFDITKASQPNIQTLDQGFMDMPVSDEVRTEALRYAFPNNGQENLSWQVLLHVAARIPDRQERKLYLNTFGGPGMRKAAERGKTRPAIRYRRQIGPHVHWVSSRAETLPDPASGDLYAFFYTSDIHTEVIREKTSARILERNYDTLSWYDTQSGQLYVVDPSDPSGKPISGGPYAEALEARALTVLAEEGVADIRERLSLKTVMSRLEDKPAYTLYFTLKERRTDLPGRPRRRMLYDIFYLDDYRDAILFLLTDVTDIFEQERKHREKLARALQVAEAANEAKSSFLSRISHDIRTPLNVIISKTDFAFEDLDQRDLLKNDLSDIKAASAFLLSLINDILDLSQIDSGTMVLHPEPYAFDDYLTIIRGLFTPLCDEKGIVLDIRNEEAVPVAVVDKVRLNQITLNLLTNAVKYTDPGGRVTFTASSHLLKDGMARCRISVADTGSGISPEFQAVMFEPFTRDSGLGGRTLTEQGTGLGLSIVKKIADLMGGDITVDSVPGQGTTISLAFTCPTGNPSDSLPSPGVKDFDEAPTPASLSGTVLVAEDMAMNAKITERLLTSFGLDAVIASNGAEALENFRSAPPGTYKAILMDIQMPVMDGYGATRAIRALDRPDAAEIPIFAMSANAFQDDVAHCLEAGMNGHIAKPIDVDILHKTLARAFR